MSDNSNSGVYIYILFVEMATKLLISGLTLNDRKLALFFVDINIYGMITFYLIYGTRYTDP